MLVGGGQVDEHGDAHHVEAEHVGIVRNLEVFPVVGEVDHGLQVQILLGVVEHLGEDVVRVEDAVGIGLTGGDRRLALGSLEFAEGRGIAVVVVNVAAHDMEHHEIVLGGVKLGQVRQQGLIVLVGEVVGVVRPLGVVGSLGYQSDGAVVLAVAALVAEPPGFIAGFLGHVNDGGGVKELLAVVLALLREGPLEHRYRLGPGGIGMAEDEEVVIFCHGGKPGGILIGKVGGEGLHVVAGGRFADDEDYRAGCLGRQGHALVDGKTVQAFIVAQAVLLGLLHIGIHVKPQAGNGALGQVEGKRPHGAQHQQG